MIAEKLGTPLLPWQQYVADVALEINTETGRLQYREVVLTVPRQSGKTTLILAVSTHRAFGFPGRQNIVYTAQTRGKARQKWAEDHIPALEASIFARVIRDIRYANDSEALYWANGSRYGIEAGTETAGHGSTLDMAFLDEAFSEVDARKEQALRPTMSTRPEPQIWVVSTAGNHRSTYLWAKVKAGRARIEAHQPSSIAYFEWSAPDSADSADESVWWQCMPALGLTQSIEGLRSDRESMLDKDDEFRRAYLNQWRVGQAVEQVIPAEDWSAARDEVSRIIDGAPRRFSVDVSPDRMSAAIGVAGLREDGLMHLEVLKHSHGVAWIPEALDILEAKYNSQGPVILAGKAAAALQADLLEHGIESVVMSSSDSASGAAMLFDRTPERLRHIGQHSLDAALAGATKRTVGDGWAWDKRGQIDITPLCAVTGALFGYYLDGADDYDIADSLPDV